MYPNQQVEVCTYNTPGYLAKSQPVWLFSVDIVDKRMTHTFSVRADITWAKFSKDVCQYFDRPIMK